MPERVRLDKWLWAARFFRTRGLAREAIEGGKVWYEGARPKVSRDVDIGAEIRIRQGFDEKTVIVTGLSAERRGAPEAALLYSETEASITAREAESAARRMARAGFQPPATRPDKRDRRLIHRFEQEAGE